MVIRDGGEVCQRKRSVTKTGVDGADSKEQPLSWKQIQAYNYFESGFVRTVRWCLAKATKSACC